MSSPGDSRSAQVLSPTASNPDRTRLNALRQELDNLIATHIQDVDPSFGLTESVKPISFEQMQAAIPDNRTALIAWYVTGDHLTTFILTRQWNQPRVIPSTTDAYKTLVDTLNTYLSSYIQQKDLWQTQLPTLLQQLATALDLEQLLHHLPADCDQLILVPHRFLHLVPLHALSLAPTTASNPEANPHPCLLDRFPRGVGYAPSIQILKLTQTLSRPPLVHLFGVQNPTEDLQFTNIEVAALRRRFQPHDDVLVQDQAEKTALTPERLGQANCAHFSCHGYFNFEHPELSALLLADSQRQQTAQPETSQEKSRYLRSRDGGTIDLEKCLTLGEIFTLDLRQCRLVTLSACETGLTDFKSLSDEYIGLPSGFLYAGSPSVVSSLWAVNDLSTTFLMIKFYQNLQNTVSVALALNSAQLWLRQVTKQKLLTWISQLPLRSSQAIDLECWTDKLATVDDDTRLFESPYHWAAFCAIGQ